MPEGNSYIKNLVVLMTLFTACKWGNNTIQFEHTYSKYWQKYNNQQLLDTLFSDTLNISLDRDGGRIKRKNYIGLINSLVETLYTRKKCSDSLFPMSAFDEVKIEFWNFDDGKILSQKETSILLEVINDPVSFEWIKSGRNCRYAVRFFNNKKQVAFVVFDEEGSICIPDPIPSNLKAMKFGTLKKSQRKKILNLLLRNLE